MQYIRPCVFLNCTLRFPIGRKRVAIFLLRILLRIKKTNFPWKPIDVVWAVIIDTAYYRTT